MKQNILIQTRFSQLADQAEKIRMGGRDGTVTNRADFYSWVLSAINVIRASFGTQSPHYQAFSTELATIQNNYVSDDRLNAFRGMFASAKSDYEGGFAFDIERTITAEVFGDIVAAAKAALDEGNHTVAAVLA